MMTEVSATLTLDKASARTWPVVVVGAGPAGSFLARCLATAGIPVLFLDRATFPRWKVCGCCLNGAALTLLKASGLEGLVSKAVPLTGIHLSAGGRAVELSLREGMALSREAFDRGLVESAIERGAEFLPGTSARLLPVGVPGQRQLRLRQGDREMILRADVVVAADGLGGQFLAGEPGHEVHAAPSAWIGAGITRECPTNDYRSGKIHMACGTGGYVGLVRLEDGRLDVAAALDPDHVRRSGGLAQAAESILAEVGCPLPSFHNPGGWRGTPLLTRWIARPAGERFFLVGDAAGYIEPFTGEGMAWALASAQALAPLLIKAVGAWDRTLIGKWRHRQRTLLGQRRMLCWLLTRVLRNPTWTAALVNFLRVLPSVARPVIAGLNRTFRFPLRPVRGGKRVNP